LVKNLPHAPCAFLYPLYWNEPRDNWKARLDGIFKKEREVSLSVERQKIAIKSNFWYK
jgi:hypothetical protein